MTFEQAEQLISTLTGIQALMVFALGVATVIAVYKFLKIFF